VPRAILETCVETLDEACAAAAGGAARIELCANLAEQGTTPDASVTDACAAAVDIPIFVMIRPRPGDFVYSSDEVAVMRQQIAAARSHGARGIVTGALTRRQTIDLNTMAALVRAAGPLPVTFHRAFDRIDDRGAALQSLLDLGVSRVLTSGGAATAGGGADQIARLVTQAAGRLIVMAGGGIRARNVRDLLARSAVKEVHAHLTTREDVRALVANLDIPPAD
jgi:copper homeostasis protein